MATRTVRVHLPSPKSSPPHRTALHCSSLFSRICVTASSSCRCHLFVWSGKSRFARNWLSDSATYPIIAIISGACGLVVYQARTHTHAQWKEKGGWKRMEGMQRNRASGAWPCRLAAAPAARWLFIVADRPLLSSFLCFSSLPRLQGQRIMFSHPDITYG